MTLKKKVKVLLGSILGTTFLLFAVLVAHIVVMVKNRKPLENPTIQMARVDFRQPVHLSDLTKMEHRIKDMNGVKDTYFNQGSNILIYTFDAKLNSAERIYNGAIKNAGFGAEWYVVAKGDEAKGCPAMDNHSFYGKLTSVVENSIN